MSLFSWLSPGRKKSESQHSVLPDSAFSRMDSTKPFNGGQNGRHEQHAQQPTRGQRKQERVAHREQLYAVVREAMVRAGVLSSSYKFKVLSLDTQGRQFMVMVDLAHGAVADTSRLAEIEVMIAQAARAKFDMLVTAVYWRANEHVSVGDPAQPRTSQPAPLMAEAPQRRSNSRPAPLAEVPTHPTPLAAAPQAAAAKPAAAQPATAKRAGVEPLQAQEVTAFKQALDAGLRGEQALAAANNGRQPQNYTLLTGFEDTEMAADDTINEQLSGTQYGALR
jgi:hypothetical protein